MTSGAKRSAGLLPYRRRAGRIEVLLVHPGGPFFARRDEGAWSIPKGELAEGDVDELAAARRELAEETSFEARTEDFLPLGEVRQKGGKTVVAWAFEGDFDPAALASNEVELEWRGSLRRFPEVDRAAWYGLEAAKEKLLSAQRPFLERLEDALS